MRSCSSSSSTVFENEATSTRRRACRGRRSRRQQVIMTCAGAPDGIYASSTRVPHPQRVGQDVLRACTRCTPNRASSRPEGERKETRSKDDHFIVKHFAGDVVSLQASSSKVTTRSAEVEAALLRSIELVDRVHARHGGSTKKKRSSFASVGAKFVKSLKGQ